MGFEKLYSRMGKLYDGFARRRRPQYMFQVTRGYWNLSDASRKYARLMNWTAGF